MATITLTPAPGSDITAALQNAANQAGPGGTVVLPAGSFNYSGVITLNGVTVIGAGPGGSGGTTLVAQNPSSEALTITGNGGGVKNLEIVGNNSAGRLTAPEEADIHAYQASNYTVSNVLMNGGACGGVISEQSNGGTITNNTVENALADSITQVSGSSNILVQGNYVTSSGDDGISNNSYIGFPLVSNITIQGNTVTDNTWGHPIEASGGSNINISGNYLENHNGYADVYIDSDKPGFSTQGISGLTLSGNTIVGGGPNEDSVIVLNTSGSSYNIAGVTISGNQFVNPSGPAVQYAGNGAESGATENNVAYMTGPFSTDQTSTASFAESNNQVLAPSSYTTPLVAPGGGVGTGGVTPPPPPPSPPSPSPNGTEITSASQPPIIDQAGNAWSLVQSANEGLQIAVNGTVDAITSDVVLLETLNGAMVQENSFGNWYSETQPNDSWVQISDPSSTPAPPPPSPSPSGTTITSPSQPAIIDASGNAWTLVQSANEGLQIAVNGTVDSITSDVVLLETLNGAMVQKNSFGNWYSESQPNDSWVQIPDPTQAPTQPGTVSISMLMSATRPQSNPTFIATVDGKQIGGPSQVSAQYPNNTKTFTYNDMLAAGKHTLEIDYTSGRGTMYVDQATIAGAPVLSSPDAMQVGGKVDIAFQT